MKKTTVYLVTKNQNVSSEITGIIKKNHGNDLVVKIVKSPRVFDTPYGFTNFMQQYADKSKINVYAVKYDFSESCLETASEEGLLFNVLYKNGEGKWQCFCSETADAYAVFK